MEKIRNIDEALLPQYINNYISFLNDLDIESLKELQKVILGFVNDFNVLFKCDILATGSITLVNSLDRTLIHAVPPNHHGITYVWSTWSSNNNPKGFAIFLHYRLATTQRDMLREIVNHELCHAKLWMENSSEKESHGPESLKTCDIVAKHFQSIGRPLEFKIKEIGVVVNGLGEYPPLKKSKHKQNENTIVNKKRRNF
jgi:hypothetical protein